MSHPRRRLEVIDDTDDSTLLKVAFATGDRLTVDQHFGSARSFVICGVDQDQSKFLSVTEFAELQDDVMEDKLADKLELLSGCIAVYCRACGASAVRQLMALGIQPVKVTEGMEISDLLQALQKELRQGPSSWLAKAIKRYHYGGRSRFDAMESDGWLD